MTKNEWKKYIQTLQDLGAPTRIIDSFRRFENTGYIPEYFQQQIKSEIQRLQDQKKETTGREKEITVKSHGRETQQPMTLVEDGTAPKPVQAEVCADQDSKEPESIRNLREQIRKSYKQYSYLHSLLPAAPVQKRYEIAKTIITGILPRIDSMYDEIRNWERTGEEPMVWDMRIVKAVMKFVGRRKALGSKIYRLNKKLEKETDKTTIAEINAELEELQPQFEYISRKLGISCPSQNNQ